MGKRLALNDMVTTTDIRVLTSIGILLKEKQTITIKKIRALTMISDKAVRYSIKRLIKAGLLLATRERTNQPYEFTVLNGGNNGKA